MFHSEWLAKPGDYPFFFDGAAGTCEGVLTVPAESNPGYLAILGHPHSLQGGTMNNKVVTTLARLFRDLHVPSVRFNFRGVGQSAGVYDAGVGESEDMLRLVAACRADFPAAQLIFAGFSFGSYVAWRTAAQSQSALLITVAPPVHHYDYTEFTSPSPWIVVQSEDDEVVPAQQVFDFCKQQPAITSLVRFETAGHFFHGQLLALKERLMAELLTQVDGLQ